MAAGPAAQQGNSTSTVLGRRLGGELLKLRLTAGLTQPQAAKTLSASTAKVAKMEGGWVPIRDPDIRALCELYGVDAPEITGGLLELARIDRERRKAKGWWNDVPFSRTMREYVTLESAATLIRTWQIAHIPGLLQTREYALALRQDASHRDPAHDERFVAARMERQRRLLADSPLSLSAVIHETALRCLVGGPDVMREQLAALARAAEQPHISVRVLPFSAGAPGCMSGAFNILSFAEPGAMDVVYLEVPFATLWVEDGDPAGRHAALFTETEQLALDETDSLEFINDIGKDL